jgi:hypothetical protein
MRGVIEREGGFVRQDARAGQADIQRSCDRGPRLELNLSLPGALHRT